MSRFYTYEKVETKTFLGFSCNKCKKYYPRDTGLDGLVETQEALYWDQTCGYGSIWGDGNELELTLCQHCAYELLSPYVEVTEKDIFGDPIENTDV